MKKMNNLKVTRKSLILMISVALVMVMAVSVVSAAFHWGTTGNAVKKIKDGQKIVVYENGDYNIELNEKTYQLRIKANKKLGSANEYVVDIERKINGAWTTLCTEKEVEDECYMENVILNILSIEKSFYKIRGMYARVKVSVSEVPVTSGGRCYSS